MATSESHRQYRRRLAAALGNPFLSGALDRFATSYLEARPGLFQGMDLDGLSRDLAEARNAALPLLGELLETFTAHAKQAGAKVHLAEDARQANAIIASIAHRHGVRKIVKAKSMTAEEVFLNDHLETEGFQVTETDLGEWIIQLRGERPSHMVLPAIHLSREQVARLFSQVTGRKEDPRDIQALVQVARSHLRQAFLEADMGITGANFAIASSGTLGVVTNEGNARLVTTLPRVHVALVGIDKLVPDLAAAFRILRVLPRNATGQAISSYVTWITGCPGPEDGAVLKKETHIVFLDNGRRALARDPVFGQALRCIRCGACANVCPIYRLVGGHAYGYVYIGAIGLVLTLFYHGIDKGRALIANCLNCQACKSVCPAGIDLPLLINRAHGRVLGSSPIKPLKNVLLASVLRDRRLFHFLLRRASLAQRPLARKGPLIRHLPLFFSGAHGFRSLPVLAATALRDRKVTHPVQGKEPVLRVGLFAGCLVDFVYPEQGTAFIELAQRFGVRVALPLEQTCCGLPAMMMTEYETARAVALQNLEAFSADRFDCIVALCASCASHLRENLPILFRDQPDLAPRLRAFTEKVLDFSSFAAKFLGLSSRSFRGTARKVTYHAPCHLCRGLKVREEPRWLLRTAGLDYVPARQEEVCCGFAGSYSVEFPEVSARLLQLKCEDFEATGARLIVTDCPGCVLQLRGGMDRRGSRMEVRHMAQVLAEEMVRPAV